MPAFDKTFLDYPDLVSRLKSRGMAIADSAGAIEQLRSTSYYRLSGYWYPFRKIDHGDRVDDFFEGTTFDDVLSLYKFDERLRVVTFASLCGVEVLLRNRMGHALGAIDPMIHTRPELLDPLLDTVSYARWHSKYLAAVADSREDFVEHHRVKYGGKMPVWVAVEVLDWGDLTYLYQYSPRHVRDDVARSFGLSAPQFRTWLRALNQLRNTCAHHGRLFNRVAQITPKFPAPMVQPAIDEVVQYAARTFGQLSLVQYLQLFVPGANMRLIPTVVASMPSVATVPLSHLGAPSNWRELTLWNY